VRDRPRIGVSACLLGERVRHDAGHKRDGWLVDVLGPQIEWVAVCPEVEAGLGTPREPIRLERTSDGGVALITVDSRRDITQLMRRYSRERIEDIARADLDGYVFKADSPSCGPDGVPIISQASTPETGRGLFADALLSRLPALAVADERRLSDPVARQAFLDRVFAHHRARAAGSPASAFSPVDVIRVRSGVRVSDTDRAAAEEPLEIRLHGRPFAVIMRTPGADRELAAGFLLAERVIREADDLGTIEHCVDFRDGPPETNADGPPESNADGPPEGGHYVRWRGSDGSGSNVVNVTLTDASADMLERLLGDRRNVQTNSSCGLCGRRTIESLAADVPPIRTAATTTAPVVASLPQRLRVAQTVFDETGGLHAAGLFTTAGELVDVAEDVGRHNAVDKIVGRMLMRERLPLSDHVLFVSGRTSFEIVQKALVAGIPILAAVSAPSSLAVDLAIACGITLIGFVRGDTFNIYAHPERIT
jgi:FdhD protein